MALTQTYTAVPNDVITAARWNNEFGNIYNNGTALAFPVTAGVSFAGFTITLDSSGVTTLISTASKALTFTPGAKSGTPGTGANSGNIVNIAASTFTDTNTAGSGIAAEFSSVSIQRPTLAASNTLVTTTDAATVYINNAPAAGTNETITNPWAIWVDSGAVRFDGNLRVDGTVVVSGATSGTLALGKHIEGLIQSNSAGDVVNDIDISAGSCADGGTTAASRKLMILASSITKQLDAAWAVGTNAGGLDTGSIGNSDYYIWLIMRSDTGVVDALYSLSSTAPTMPSNYDFKRLIGWIKRVAAAIVLFTAYELSGGGIEVAWTTPTLDISLSNTLTTSRRTDAVKVPLNFSTTARMNILIQDAAAIQTVINYNPDHADITPSVTVAPLTSIRVAAAAIIMQPAVDIRTSSTGTIAARSLTATTDDYLAVTMSFTWGRRN